MSCYSTGYTGQKYCDKGSRFGKPTAIILAKSTFTQVAADFLLEDEWLTAIKELNVFPLKDIKNFEDNSTEAQYHEYADGSRKLVEQGDYRLNLYFDLNECVKKQLLNFRGFSEGIYFVYGDVIRGRTIDSGTNIVPIRINALNIEKATFPAMDGTPEMVKVTIDLYSDKDVNEYDYSREMSWDVNDLDGLTEVTLTEVGTSTATSIVISVASECGGDSKPISGLGVSEETDWSVSEGTLTTVEESTSTPGQYTLTGTVFVTGTVNIGDPADRSDDVLVISSGAVDITVSA